MEAPEGSRRAEHLRHPCADLVASRCVVVAGDDHGTDPGGASPVAEDVSGVVIAMRAEVHDPVGDRDVGGDHAAVVPAPGLVGDEPPLRVDPVVEVVEEFRLWTGVGVGGIQPFVSVGTNGDVIDVEGVAVALPVLRDHLDRSPGIRCGESDFDRLPGGVGDELPRGQRSVRAGYREGGVAGVDAGAGGQHVLAARRQKHRQILSDTTGLVRGRGDADRAVGLPHGLVEHPAAGIGVEIPVGDEVFTDAGQCHQRRGRGAGGGRVHRRRIETAFDEHDVGDVHNARRRITAGGDEDRDRRRVGTGVDGEPLFGRRGRLRGSGLVELRTVDDAPDPPHIAGLRTGRAHGHRQGVERLRFETGYPLGDTRVVGRCRREGDTVIGDRDGSGGGP